MFPTATALANAAEPNRDGPMSPLATAHWVEHEQVVLVKRLARLQKQMSQLVLSYEAQLFHWQRQLMRQSTRLMLERTRGEWGLLRGPSAREPHPHMREAMASAETDALICRTACVMDEHHWRDGELCKRTGQVCVLTPEAEFK